MISTEGNLGEENNREKGTQSLRARARHGLDMDRGGIWTKSEKSGAKNGTETCMIFFLFSLVSFLFSSKLTKLEG